MEVSNDNIDKIPLNNLINNNLIEKIDLTGEECRICLKKSQEMWHLFDNQHEIPQKLMAFAAVQISENDGLPAIICFNCHRLLDISYNFKCQIEKSDTQLRQLLDFKQSLNQTVIETSINNDLIVNTCINNDNEVKNDNNIINENSLNINNDESIIFEVNNEEFKSINSNSNNNKQQIINENELVEKLEALVDSQDDVIKEEESVMIEESELSDEEESSNIYNHNLFNEKNNDEEIKEETEELNNIKLENLKSSSKEKCLKCIKTFGSKLLLQKHLIQHKNKTNLRYVCYMCDEQFSSIDKLKDHVGDAHGTINDKKTLLEINNELKKNDNDDEKIDNNLNLNQLNDNLIKNEKKNFKYSCKYCSKQFTYEKAFLTHAKRHNEYKNDTQLINNKSLLINNTRNINNSDEDDDDDDDDDLPRDGLQCTLCGKLFATKRNLKRHISTHSGLKFNCPTCNKEFSRIDKLKEHEQSKHKNDDFDQTDDDDDDNNDIDNDNKIKDNDNIKKEKLNNRPHKCLMCPKAFAQEQSLKNHMERHKRVKDTQKRFLCEVCSKCFAQSGSLVAHMRTHTGIKPYVCNVCNRAFTKSTYLQLHLRTHSGEKPYICQYCSRAFARANTLARHITMHTGEAKYHCQICMKSFRRLTSLNEHTYTHTGQRPYACKICTKRYNNAGSLYAHTKKCKAQQLTHNNVTFVINNHQNNQDNDINNQNPDDSTGSMIGFSSRKLNNESVDDNNVVDNVTTAGNSFMITNLQHQKPVMSNVIQSFEVDEVNVYSVNAKQFKNPYYTVYTNM